MSASKYGTLLDAELLLERQMQGESPEPSLIHEITKRGLITRTVAFLIEVQQMPVNDQSNN